MNAHDMEWEPDEHVRFTAYLDQLHRVAEADEIDLVGRILTDPDRMMAQSAVLRRLDCRAERLHLGPAYEKWAQAMGRAVSDDPFLTRRLHEWAVLRAVMLDQSWHPDDLRTASDWLQFKVASKSRGAALQILAEDGRIRRVRNTAASRLKQRRR